MKNAVFVATLLICFTSASIAADQSSAAGTYISQRDSKQFITLYPGNIFEDTQGDKWVKQATEEQSVQRPQRRRYYRYPVSMQ